MSPTNKAKIKDATNTKVELACNSAYFGHVTFSVTSAQESFTSWVNLFMRFVKNIMSVYAILYKLQSSEFLALKSKLIKINFRFKTKYSELPLHGHQDSNPDRRFWRPLYYLYTMPVCYWNANLAFCFKISK